MPQNSKPPHHLSRSLRYYSIAPEQLLDRLAPEQRLQDLKPEEQARALSVVPPEQRLKGFAPEQRLQGLAPEQRLQGLAPDDYDDRPRLATVGIVFTTGRAQVGPQSRRLLR